MHSLKDEEYRPYPIRPQKISLRDGGHIVCFPIRHGQNPRFWRDHWGTLTFWLPLYLTGGRRFDLKHIAMFAWLLFLAEGFGCMFGGVLALPGGRSALG